MHSLALPHNTLPHLPTTHNLSAGDYDSTSRAHATHLQRWMDCRFSGSSLWMSVLTFEKAGSSRLPFPIISSGNGDGPSCRWIAYALPVSKVGGARELMSILQVACYDEMYVKDPAQCLAPRKIRINGSFFPLQYLSASLPASAPHSTLLHPPLSTSPPPFLLPSRGHQTW